MHFSTFSAGFALLSCRLDSLLWKIIPVLLDSGNKVEFFRLTQTSFFVRRKNSTLFPSSSKSGIIFHSALSNLQVRNAKCTEKVEKCISLELLFFLTERKYSLTLNCQESTILLSPIGTVRWRETRNGKKTLTRHIKGRLISKSHFTWQHPRNVCF